MIPLIEALLFSEINSYVKYEKSSLGQLLNAVLAMVIYPSFSDASGTFTVTRLAQFAKAYPSIVFMLLGIVTLVSPDP